jgi:predicted nucleic acid-binding protein
VKQLKNEKIRVVADSSCFIGLAQINLFHILKELFSEVYIPYAVYDEVVIKGGGEAGSKETEDGVKDGWILKKAVNDDVGVSALTTILGKGEAEVIILCNFLLLAIVILLSIIIVKPKFEPESSYAAIKIQSY